MIIDDNYGMKLRTAGWRNEPRSELSLGLDAELSDMLRDRNKQALINMES